jgi:hypothetical protein
MDSLEKGSQEKIPAGFQRVEIPRRRDLITDRISRPGATDSGSELEFDVVDGFEDLFERPLGTGLWENTPGTVYQLSFAISISDHPLVQKVLEGGVSQPRDVIGMFREGKILSGIKIIDLGCGNKPTFALAAQALGAETYTSDAADLPQEDKEKVKSHIVLDLNQADAIQVLLNATGGNFDLVTENLTGTTPRTAKNVKRPESNRIVEIATSLLKPGGYLDYGLGVNRYRDYVLKKKAAL